MLSNLAKRCVELSFKHKLTHVSSVLNTVDLVAEIYAKRQDNEPFILGNGHAGLALYVVLERLGECDAEEMIKKHGVHPSRDMEHGIWCSSGSLGQSETVAVGYALADLKRTVWLVTSDGSCMEGSVYEAFRVSRNRCQNLNIFIIFNGTGAYGKIRYDELPYLNVNASVRVMGDQLPVWLQGLPGHYLQLTEAQRDELLA